MAHGDRNRSEHAFAVRLVGLVGESCLPRISNARASLLSFVRLFGPFLGFMCQLRARSRGVVPAIDSDQGDEIVVLRQRLLEERHADAVHRQRALRKATRSLFSESDSPMENRWSSKSTRSCSVAADPSCRYGALDSPGLAAMAP